RRRHPARDGGREDRRPRAHAGAAGGPGAGALDRSGRAGRLAAFELRLALLGEGGQALLGVLAREREVEIAALGLGAGGEGRLVGAVDGLLREPGGDGALRGDL